MKKLFAYLTAASLGLALEAEENPNPQHFTVSLGSSIINRYLDPSTGKLFSTQPAVQTDFVLTHQSGIYLGLWNSRSLRGKWNDGSYGNEVDYSLGWSGDIKGLTIGLLASYYDEPSAFTFGADDILYSQVEIEKAFTHFSILLGYENFTTMPGSSFGGGNLFGAGLGKKLSFYKEKLELSTTLEVVYDTGTFGDKSECFGRGVVGLNWNLSKHFVLNLVTLNYYLRHNADMMVATGFTLSF